MNTYRYTGYMTDGTEVTRLVIARDGDEARRLGRQSAEVDGRRVVLQTVMVVEEVAEFARYGYLQCDSCGWIYVGDRIKSGNICPLMWCRGMMQEAGKRAATLPAGSTPDPAP